MNDHIVLGYHECPVALESAVDPCQGDYQYDGIDEKEARLHPVHNLICDEHIGCLIPAAPVECPDHHSVGLDDSCQKDEEAETDVEDFMAFNVVYFAFFQLVQHHGYTPVAPRKQPMGSVEDHSIDATTWVVEKPDCFLFLWRVWLKIYIVHKNSCNDLHGPRQGQQDLHSVEEGEFGIPVGVYEQCDEYEAGGEAESDPFSLDGEVNFLGVGKVGRIPHLIL